MPWTAVPATRLPCWLVPRYLLKGSSARPLTSRPLMFRPARMPFFGGIAYNVAQPELRIHFPMPRAADLEQTLDLPPGYTLVALRELGDAFAHARNIAGEAGAGT